MENLDGALDLPTLLVLRDRESYYFTVNFSDDLLGLDEGEVLTMLSDLHAFVHVPKPKYLDEAIHILHDSLPDFLFDKSRYGRFFIDPQNGHANVTAQWIKYVQRQSRRNHGVPSEANFFGTFFLHRVLFSRSSNSRPAPGIQECYYHNWADYWAPHAGSSHGYPPRRIVYITLEAHIVLYAGVAFSKLIQQLFDFIQWLKISVCFLCINNEMTLPVNGEYSCRRLLITLVEWRTSIASSWDILTAGSTPNFQMI